MAHPRTPSNEEKKKLNETLKSIWEYLAIIKSSKKTPQEKQEYRKKLQTAYSSVNRHLIDEKLEIKVRGQEPRKALGILNEATKVLATTAPQVVKAIDRPASRGIITKHTDEVEVLVAPVVSESKVEVEKSQREEQIKKDEEFARKLQAEEDSKRPKYNKNDETLAEYLNALELVKLQGFETRENTAYLEKLETELRKNKIDIDAIHGIERGKKVHVKGKEEENVRSKEYEAEPESTRRRPR